MVWDAVVKIAVMSDLHLEFERGPYRTLGTDSAGHPDVGPRLDSLTGGLDVLVLAGDVDVGAHGFAYAEAAARFLAVPVVLIAGNHEFYGGDRRDRHMDTLLPSLRERSSESAGRVRFLERDTAIVGGVRFLGCVLWTDFGLFGAEMVETAMQAAQSSLADFTNIRYRAQIPFSPDHACAEFRRAIDFLKAELAQPFDGLTVVVTHHAPSTGSVAARFAEDLITAAFVSILDDLVGGSGVPLWIHGHTHDSFDYRIGATRVLCNPRGYWPGDLNPRFDPRLVVTV